MDCLNKSGRNRSYKALN